MRDALQKRLRLLALVPKPVGLSPGQRFRLEQWAPHLRDRHGIDLHFSIFESPELTATIYQPGKTRKKAILLLRDTWARRAVIAQAREYDGVVVYREASMLGPAIIEHLLARAGVPLYYDFDDAIWISNVASVNGLFSHLRFAGKTSTICRIARAVSVGNEYLAQYARQYNPSVHIVRTSIELALNPAQPPLTNGEPLVVGWTGSKSTLTHLELARPVLERLGRRRRVRLRVICSEPPVRPFKHVETEFVRWTAEREAADLGPIHVGIMPLPDDPFANGKCACKALQYMAAGRPVVTHPVGMNTEIIRSGENGVLARTDDEWVEALEALAASPERRATLGAAGRHTVEDGFSTEHSAERFAHMIRSTQRSN